MSTKSPPSKYYTKSIVDIKYVHTESDLVVVDAWTPPRIRVVDPAAMRAVQYDTLEDLYRSGDSESDSDSDPDSDGDYTSNQNRVVIPSPPGCHFVRRLLCGRYIIAGSAAFMVLLAVMRRCRSQ